jgi:cell division protein FtsL
LSSVRFLVWLAALLAAVLSGIQVSNSAHEARSLHGELEAAQKAQDNALAAQSRLLLERSALAAYQNVESIAQQQLGMEFPKTVKRVTQ